jgi:hypothetical protein
MGLVRAGDKLVGIGFEFLSEAGELVHGTTI